MYHSYFQKISSPFNIIKNNSDKYQFIVQNCTRCSSKQIWFIYKENQLLLPNAEIYTRHQWTGFLTVSCFSKKSRLLAKNDKCINTLRLTTLLINNLTMTLRRRKNHHYVHTNVAVRPLYISSIFLNYILPNYVQNYILPNYVQNYILPDYVQNYILPNYVQN